MQETTGLLHELTLTPIDKRDDAWETRFLEMLPHARVKMMFTVPQVAADNWPYMFVQTSPEGTEPVSKLLKWASERGIGLAINPQKKENLDYLLNFGMIWSFTLRGAFRFSRNSVAEGKFEIPEQTKIMAGAPAEEYLPTPVRNVLRTFLVEQGVLQPRILVMGSDQKNYDLCLSLDSLGNPPSSEHAGIAEAISWFLPHDYSFVLCQEAGLPQFHPL